MLPKVLEEGIGQFCPGWLLEASGFGEDRTEEDGKGSLCPCQNQLCYLDDQFTLAYPGCKNQLPLEITEEIQTH